MYGLGELESLSAKNQRSEGRSIVMILLLAVSEQREDWARISAAGQTNM